ncbi:MAG: hypothetical protein LC793_12675 [Thermomicrobia bacterium]|nr:hypothetical protein [Thermomicrobia bacterium]
MSSIFAVNNRRFDPLGDRSVPGSAPARPAYSHESQGVTYTLEPSASGGYLMTSTTDEAAVEVLDVDHAARLIDEIEGTAGEDHDARRAEDNLARGERERQMPAEQPLDIAKDTKPVEREIAPARPLHPAMEERLGAEAAEGHAMAHRAGEAAAGQQDWLAADEVAMLHVPGQATPTPGEVHEHSVRRRDAAGEEERGDRVPGRIRRWVMLAVATAVAGGAVARVRVRGRRGNDNRDVMEGERQMAGRAAHAPGPSPCLECGGARVVAEAYSGMQLVASGSHQSSELRALVCVSCGHATFYAKEPERMIRRES